MAFPHGAPDFRAWTLPPHDMHGDFDPAVTFDDERWRPPALLAHILAGMKAQGYAHDLRVRESLVLYAGRRRTALLSVAMLALTSPDSPMKPGMEETLEDVCNWGALFARARAMPPAGAAVAARTLDEAARAAVSLAQTVRGAPAPNTGDVEVCWPSLLCVVAAAKCGACVRWWDSGRVQMHAVRTAPVRTIAFDAYMLRITRAAVLSSALDWSAAVRAWSEALALLPETAWSKLRKRSTLQHLPETVVVIGVQWPDECLCSHATGTDSALRMPEHCPVLVASLAYYSGIERCIAMRWWQSARALMKPLAHLVSGVRAAHPNIAGALDTIERAVRAAEVRMANAQSLDAPAPAPAADTAEPRPAQLIRALELPVTA